MHIFRKYQVTLKNRNYHRNFQFLYIIFKMKFRTPSRNNKSEIKKYCVFDVHNTRHLIEFKKKIGPEQ